MANLFNLSTGEAITLLVQHIVGRHPVNSNTVLSNPGASRMHAVFLWEQDRWCIKDLSSANGTFINNERLPAEEKRTIKCGDKIRFGSASAEEWEVRALAAPQSALLPLSDGLPTILLNDIIALPSEEKPEITIYQSKEGHWICESLQGTVQLKTGDPVGTHDKLWQFVDCNPTLETLVIDDKNKSQDDICFYFNVSQNEEHVSIKLVSGDNEVDLLERTHHYLVLLLARNRMADKAAGISEKEQGWIDKEQLGKMSGLSEYHINIHIYRFRKQLIKAIPDNNALNQTIERRSGQLRFYYDAVEVPGEW